MLPEIVVDSFAGGGGASEGMEAALRRMNRLGQLPPGAEPYVTVAINHDAKALQMHAANHPKTLHLPHDVWKVDPQYTVNGQPVGLLWASPDCRHHSKAKGGKPVSCSVRSLAWVVANWAEQVKPRLIMLENVEEFADWGPLTADDRPDRDRKGETFRQWIARFTRLGYRVDWRVLRACDYGAPTIRKRLYVIMRCDGEPILWPPASHGDPNSEAVKSGRLKPWRTAAEIVDWDRPCPSILMSRDEAKAYTAATGIRINRPLADKSEKRIAEGIRRWVLEEPDPFVIETGGFVSYGQQGGLNRSAGKPLHTVCASTKDTNTIVVPYFVPRYGERDGQAPRTRAADTPYGAVVPGGNTGSLCAAYVGRQFGNSIGSHPRAPLGAVMAGGGGKTQAISAFIAQNNNDARRTSGVNPGRRATEPVSTLSTVPQQAVVSLPLMSAYYSEGGQWSGMRDPMLTVPTKARFGLIDPLTLLPPMTTDQADSARKVAAFLRRHGAWDGGEFVTVTVRGHELVIVDIGMRMLTPRELARAQGFTDDYDLEAADLGSPLTETDQRHKIGNSVCWPVADALVYANYRPQLREAEPAGRQDWLFADAGMEDMPRVAAE